MSRGRHRSDGPRRRIRENATKVVSLVVTGVWLAALLADQGWWLPFMLFGYVVLVPLTAIAVGDDSAAWWGDEEEAETETETDPLAPGADAGEADSAVATLRERYARGELTDEEFERKLDRLLETEGLDDPDDQPGVDPDRELGRE
jgi:uncharacterized membrane protein